MGPNICLPRSQVVRAEATKPRNNALGLRRLRDQRFFGRGPCKFGGLCFERGARMALPPSPRGASSGVSNRSYVLMSVFLFQQLISFYQPEDFLFQESLLPERCERRSHNNSRRLSLEPTVDDLPIKRFRYLGMRHNRLRRFEGAS